MTKFSLANNIVSITSHDLITGTHYTVKHILGSLAHPYVTWKKLRRGSLYLPTVTLLLLYALVYSLRIPLTYPVLPHFTFLTKIILNILLVIFSYHLMISFFYLISKTFQAGHSFKAVYNTWIFSYTPTIIWFFFAQVSYYLLPPPRQITTLGYLYSLLFIIGTIALVSWKSLLYYFTLRISLQLTPRQTLFTTLLFIPLLSMYVYGLYLLQLWRIPFL